jgi:protein SCO1/2
MAAPTRDGLVVVGALVLAGALGVAAATVWGRPSAELPTYGRVPAALLTDQRAQPFSTESLRGSVWVADFIFTRCSGQCPMMTSAMARLAEELDPSVRLVSFTVDPEWDQPDVLARYASTYAPASAASDALASASTVAAASERWRFVTGSREQIETLCRDGFLLAASGELTPAEPITHSGRLVLVDRTGTIRGYYDAQDAEQMRRLRRHVAWLERAS